MHVLYFFNQDNKNKDGPKPQQKWLFHLTQKDVCLISYFFSYAQPSIICRATCPLIGIPPKIWVHSRRGSTMSRLTSKIFTISEWIKRYKISIERPLTPLGQFPTKSRFKKIETHSQNNSKISIPAEWYRRGDSTSLHPITTHKYPSVRINHSQNCRTSSSKGR